jgi:hypothetical protein
MSLASVLRACAGDGAPSLSIQRGAAISAVFLMSITTPDYNGLK